MGIAFLLMGLLPLIFLPDLMGNTATEDTLVPDPQEDDGDDDFLDNEFNDLDLKDGNLTGGEETGDTADDTIKEAAEILPPNDEDDPPDDGSQNPDPLDILAPVDEDDTATPPTGTDDDALLPVDQIESVSDDIWVNLNENVGLGYSEVENFQAGQNILHVLVNPGAAVGELDLKVETSDDGQDAMVYIEQQLVAILKNAPDATASDVLVEIGMITG